jgi:HPt (histidine-containing phosphotransfer) domain-containing protein
VPAVPQPFGTEIILNDAILAQLESIGPDRIFVENLLRIFIETNQSQINRLEASLRFLQFDASKRILHVIKGSAATIGACALKAACQRFEHLSAAEMQRDSTEILLAIKSAFRQVCEALEQYRIQRNYPGYTVLN